MTKSDLEKLKGTYRQLTKDAHSAKEKYKEAMVKGEEDFPGDLLLEKETMVSLGLPRHLPLNTGGTSGNDDGHECTLCVCVCVSFQEDRKSVV